jgi:hypothetical protein
MPTDTLTDELYHFYDTVVSKTLSELINRSPYHDTIRLMGFDRKNVEHLFILRMALMVRDLCQVPVEVGGNWWDGVVINWKIRKQFDKIKIVNPLAPNGIWTPSLVGKIKSETQCYHLDSVYNAYYEGSCD